MQSTEISREDIKEQALGNVEIIKPNYEIKPLEEPVVKYTIPPDLDVIGVNTPRYDCCVQKVIDEMGIYIKDYGMQFVIGQDSAPREIIQYFPKHVLYFRSGTVPGTPPEVIQMLDSQITYFHSLGMKVFYYLDDYLLGVNNRAPIQLMTNCDGIIVSTTTLRDAILAEGISRPIYLLRTHVALNMFGMLLPIPDLKSSDRLNMLFSSQGRIGVLQLVRLLEKLEQKPDLAKKLHLFCLSHEVAQIRSVINKFRSIRKTYLEWLPLDMYYRLCTTVDVMLAPGEVGDLDYMMPREVQKPWLDSKSCHKYTVAGAASIPCISSPLQDYVEAIRHGETGFIAETDEQWIEYIELLATNEEFRKEMGAAAKRDVEKNWSLYDRTRNFADIFNGKAEPSNAPTAVEVRSELEGNPPVLVYIPVHNYHQYIRECLDSVISQSYPNQEVVVCDNASDDGTREIIETEYPQVKLIKYDTFYTRNPGIVQAVKESKCKFFIGLGADDKLVPNFWESVLPYFSNSEIGVVRVGYYRFNDENPNGVWVKPLPMNSAKDLLSVNRIFISSPARREAFDSIEFDNECFLSDWDMWIQMLLVKGWKWATCKKPMFWYRRHSDAQSLNFNIHQAGPEYTYMREKWLPYLLKYGVTKSVMASMEDINTAKKNSKYALEEIKDTEYVSLATTNLKATNYPKALVIIPTHNSIKYIKECLDSVVSQKYPNQEIVLGDNCSDDGTPDLVKNEYPMVKIVRTAEFNPKLNPLTSTIINTSDCRFVTTLGSDDKLCPDFWETLIPLFDAPDVGFVRIGCYQFRDDDTTGTWWKPFSWHEPREIFEGNKVFMSSPVRRECWDSVGGIDTHFIWGDWDFWMNAVLKGWKWRTYEKPMYWYRRHLDQESWKASTYNKEDHDYMKNKWLPTMKKLGVKSSMLATPQELAEGV